MCNKYSITLSVPIRNPNRWTSLYAKSISYQGSKGAFRAKSRPAAVAQQTGQLTLIFFVMLDGRYVQTCVRSENPGRNTGVT